MILFARDKWCDCEVYNDLDSQLVNLFRVVKYHREALEKELAFMYSSREQFSQVLQNPGYTDIQRASRFIFLLVRSFSNDLKCFGINRQNSGATSAKNLIDRLEPVSKRLDKVFIENQSFEKLIPSFDRQKAFFYCDPPYTGGHGYAVTSTAKFEHEKLAEILHNLKGYFCLSYDDSDKVRSLYKDFNILEVERKTNPSGYNRVNKSFKELAITNYELVFDKEKNLYKANENL